MSISIHSVYGQIFKIWRPKRFQWFVERVGPRPSDMLLDVGGYPSYWMQSPQLVRHIDTLNVHTVPWNPGDYPAYSIRALTGNGCHLEFSDRAYDILYSNSVIEHVGTWEDQQQFAAEVRRVGRSLWVQTPARECPLEPHFIAPVLHWLPVRLRRRLVRWCSVWGWIERPSQEEVDQTISSIRLLTKEEMARLFPDCEILIEKILGIIPKSYIAIRTHPR